MNTIARLAPSARTVALLTLVAGSLAACKKKPTPAPTPTTTTTTTTVDDDSEARAREAARLAAEERARFVRDSTERANRDREAALGRARAALTATVYFDYDQADIRDDTRAALEAKIPLLVANPSVRLRVAGHTDSRGSDEYNIALGSRRAAAVKAFLGERGIDGSRVEIASLGEERPTCSEEDESCWSRNRRAEFEITAGGNPMMLPPGTP